MKQIEDIIQVLKEKYPDIKTKDIEEIVRHQFEFLKDEIKSGKLNTVKLPYLGKFYVRESTKERIKERDRVNGLLTDEEISIYKDV